MLGRLQESTFGDGHVVKANGCGVVKNKIGCQRSQKLGPKSCPLCSKLVLQLIKRV